MTVIKCKSTRITHLPSGWFDLTPDGFIIHAWIIMTLSKTYFGTRINSALYNRLRHKLSYLATSSKLSYVFFLRFPINILKIQNAYYYTTLQMTPDREVEDPLTD